MTKQLNETTCHEDRDRVLEFTVHPTRQRRWTSPSTRVRRAAVMHLVTRPAKPRVNVQAVGAAALVCVGVVLAGCSGAPAATGAMGAATAQPSVGPVATGISSPSQVTRPIDGYFLSADQIAATEYARIVAANTCLATKGYPTAGAKADSDVAAAIAQGLADRVVRSDLYGFFDTLDAARRYGYQRPPGTPGSWGVTWSPDVPSDVVDTCFTEAAKSVGVDDAMNLVLADGLPDGGPPVPSGDAVYVKAVGAWSTCMSEHGYTYTDPQAAIGDARWRSDIVADSASTAQIATATADVGCKVSTNLIGVAMAVQGAYDQQYIDAHADQLAAYRERLQQAVRGAGQAGSS